MLKVKKVMVVLSLLCLCPALVLAEDLATSPGAAHKDLKSLSNGLQEQISSFASFSIREKGERIGRNPKTGVEVPILPRKVIVFKASHVLKDRINKGA